MFDESRRAGWASRAHINTSVHHDMNNGLGGFDLNVLSISLSLRFCQQTCQRVSEFKGLSRIPNRHACDASAILISSSCPTLQWHPM
jgi:hypothetical protein